VAFGTVALESSTGSPLLENIRRVFLTAKRARHR
jgi:hypothetical protein